jgi:asparagine synthase (glutamine-hydrolysing)
VYEDTAAAVGLVSARLAILDLDGGAQPMEGEQTSIVFNGEIYNAPALRERLERDGVRFATDHSDTEVVLRLYEQVGERCVEELNGMFAFVIHDRARGMLFGARDRFGIKPLYLARPGGDFAFASEHKVLLAFPGIEREVDRESLFHYLSLRFVPGERSILRGVERLPAAHRFTYDLATRRLEIQRWWRLEFEPDDAPDRAEWARRLRET